MNYGPYNSSLNALNIQPVIPFSDGKIVMFGKLSINLKTQFYYNVVRQILAMNGNDVSKMLGHSSINMTKKYARVVDDLISRDMQKIYSKYEDVRIN